MSLYQDLKQKLEAVKAESDPLRKEKAAIEAELAPKWARVRELSKQIAAIEKPLAELTAALNPLEKQEAKRLKREAEKQSKPQETP